MVRVRSPTRNELLNVKVVLHRYFKTVEQTSVDLGLLLALLHDRQLMCALYKYKEQNREDRLHGLQ